MPYAIKTVEPQAEPVSLAEAKTWCRVDADDVTQDPNISGLITAARQYVEAITKFQLVTATWKLSLDSFYDPEYSSDTYNGWTLRLPKPPLVSVSSLTYVDTGGTTQTIAAANYVVDTNTKPGRVTPSYTTTWPAARNVLNAVNVTYISGYATPFTAVAATDVITLKGKNPADGDKFRLQNSGGALPAGLVTLTDYYAVSSSGATCKLSLTLGGAAVDITDAGSGTSFLGEVPESLRSAMKILVSHWYENREVVGRVGSEVAMSVNALLWSERTGEYF